MPCLTKACIISVQDVCIISVQHIQRVVVGLTRRGDDFLNIGLVHFDSEAANAFPAPLAIAAHASVLGLTEWGAVVVLAGLMA